jgi:2-polyprenyl-3-methyl-5-hydroxy-6-metoxy-1,4-benzoquinol methylase
MKKIYYIKLSLDAYLISEEKGEVDPKFVKPIGKNMSYTRYNYRNSGFVSSLKIRHFEEALKMTKEYFHKCNAIDSGCADGAFLPSLSRYFNKVIGIDNNPTSIRVASRLVKIQMLDNVELICNSNKEIHELKSEMTDDGGYHVLYLLETLEHIDDKKKKKKKSCIILRLISLWNYLYYWMIMAL